MRKKIFVILIVFSFVNVASLAFLLTTTTGVTTTEPLFNEPLRIGSKIRDADYEINHDVTPKSKASSSSETTDYSIEETKMWLSLDNYFGYYFFTDYDLWDVGIGDSAEIWIQADRSWSDPDPQGRSYPDITAEQVTTLLEEFEDTIIPSDEAYFGTPDFHNGISSLLEAWGYVPPGYYYSETGKKVVLVSNVRDDNYYTDFPYYIAGFYSPTFEGYFDRNIISIDSYQWEERIGPDGARPYLYEGVIAHEYQHLIHDDYFVESELWMNEGCSMFAEILCGYPTDWGSINTFLTTPDNSLTEWGDHGDINILADYGAVFLWATYLVDNYGASFLKNYVMNGVAGVPGIEALLPGGLTFDDVFHDWTIDNLMGTGYTRLDFNDKEAGEAMVYEVKDKWPTDVFGTDFGNTITILDYDTGISMVSSYGTDYVLLSKLKWQYSSELWFDGFDTAWKPHWDKDGTAWYSSESGPLSALNLFLDVDLTGTSTLSFDTMYIIEPGWDFGFVQISTDGGATWDPLIHEDMTSEHEGTTDEIQANLPGLTGVSDGWVTMAFDLTGYEGPAIIRFLYMNDWAAQWPGWWIDNVEIDGTPVLEDDFWSDYDPPLTSFMVTVLRQDFWDGEYHYNLIAEFDVDGSNDFVLDLADFLSSPGEGLRYPDVVLAITPRVGLTDYSFSVVPT